MKQRRSFIRQPDRIASYFKSEVPVLIIVTISGLIYNIGMVAGPYFEGRLAQCLYDIFHHRAVWRDMVTLALCYVAVIGGVQAMRAVKRFSVRRFANNVSRNMRRCPYNSLVHPDADTLKDESLGSLLTKAIADVDACTEGMRKFTTELFDTGVVMIAYIVMLARYDWRLTILACLFTPLAYFAADRLKARVTAANAAYKQSESALNGVTMDRIDHAVTCRLYGREADRNAAAEEALSDYEKKSARANLYEGATTPLYDAVAMIGAVMILYFGARNVAGTGWIAWNIAAFTTFLACFTKLAVKASHAAKLFNSVQKASVSWKRIQPLMREAVDDDWTVMDRPVVPVSLTFDDVACGYREPNFLHHISFAAHPGEIIGITGEIASGKSLLGKILIGEVPYTGTITVGAKNFAEMDQKERLETFTYMGHEPELLSTTFRDNITLGSAVDAENFLRRTAMDQDLAAMHRTPDSPVGAGGAMLSGGQQARLALARTLAHARAIVILDDPFAAVDPKTEVQIFKDFRTHGKNQTLLLISHRLAHFPECDHVLYLHDGTGTFLTHTAMLEAEPGYRSLYLKQTLEGDRHEN